ncbi:MAG: CDP-diacylglycerol--serine O-phosphatidyltransferase [Deltaproteobacteria bacterium]|nr:CDP-diacylglycerol--serine O-phosphatidyltransferase [Deltaproteobacteria bacterium]
MKKFKIRKFNRLKRGNRRTYDMRKGIYILPNLFTTTSLFCGFYSIVQTLKGHYYVAAWAIFVAGIFDMLDGRIARLTRASSDFGTEYDSLCDLASFGMAPVLLAYSWSLQAYPRIGVAAAFLFFACGAMRLARYNVQSVNVERKNFQGLPIPMAAGLLITYVIFYHHYFGRAMPGKSVLFLSLTILAALLMVSNVPYRSFKQFTSRRRASFFYLVGLAVVIFFFIISPHEFVFIACLIYTASGMVEYVLQKIFVAKSPSKELTLELGGPTPPYESESLQSIH